MKNTIEIKYEDYQTEEVKKCKEFFNNNNFLANEMNESIDETITVENFYSLVGLVIEKVINKYDIFSLINDEEFLKMIYLNKLINDVLKYDDTVFELKDAYSSDLVNFLLSTKYRNFNVPEIVKDLDNKENMEELFSWLKEKARYDSYNLLLDVYATGLKQNDAALYNNFPYFLKSINKDSDNYRKILKDYGKERLNLEKLSSAEAENLFDSFLIYINAPTEWKEKYLYLKENELIEFTYDEENEKSVYDINDDKISITSDATTRTFVDFVHEFIHCVVYIDNNPPVSITEFPSIYYEYVAAEFLASLGYNKGIITDTIISRNNNNCYAYESTFPMLAEINKYKNNGPISRESIMAEIKQNLLSSDIRIAEAMRLTLLEKLSSSDYERNADMICDVETVAFLIKGEKFLEGYSYLVGNTLASRALTSDVVNKRDKMIDITRNLDSYTAIDIIDYFNTDDKTTEKQFVKKI